MARSTNHLSSSLSPYLLQHQYNPVNWYPWEEKALQRAQIEEKPIFLSIGYSACHWCHVMEKESFEDEQIAKILNEHFINIKVDREERPDLDQLYMSCVQAMAGHGGWPMSLFLTPDLKPFYAGTYFPPSPRYGMPSFRSILLQIIEAWKHGRLALIDSSEKVFHYLQQREKKSQALQGSIPQTILTQLATDCLKNYDPLWGGFGNVPKFPQTGILFALLRQHHHQPTEETSEMIVHTLQKMAQGGIYDQIGGGFHRYSVDEMWLVPHFEKMLYDNALLSRLYLEAYQLTKKEEFLDIALHTQQYLMREMQDPLGGFYSAEDADSEGEEGKFYVWSFSEIQKNLQEPSLFCEVYGVSQEGNFEGHTILHQAKAITSLTPQEKEKLASDRQALLQARSTRIKPHLDDKVLVDWNALTISSLTKAYQITKQNLYLEAAQKAAYFIENQMTREGRLYHLWRKTLGSTEGFLEDYANYTLALLDLYESDFNLDWLHKAKRTLETMVDLFWDTEEGAFYTTSKEHSFLLLRKKTFTDEATPAGNAQAALALLRLASYYEEQTYHQMAETILFAQSALLQKAPQWFGTMLCAADSYLSSMQQIVLTGSPNDPTFQEFLRILYDTYLPHRVLAVSDKKAALELPICKGKNRLEVQAFICYQGTCLPPITDSFQLKGIVTKI